MQQVAISQTAPVAPVTPQDRLRSADKSPARVMPDWPSIDARNASHHKLLPYKQNPSFDMSRVMDLVQAVLTEPDPEAALSERLSSMQAAQQARFANLPDRSKSDDLALLRHQHQLGANQTTHDAALKVLRLISVWGA